MARLRSPIGSTAQADAARRAAASARYRAERSRVGPYRAIAKLVIQRPTALGMSQRELARRVGTSEPAISRLENGRHGTSIQTLRRVFIALGGTFVLGYELPAGGRSRRRRIVLKA